MLGGWGWGGGTRDFPGRPLLFRRVIVSRFYPRNETGGRKPALSPFRRDNFKRERRVELCRTKS